MVFGCCFRFAVLFGFYTLVCDVSYGSLTPEGCSGTNRMNVEPQKTRKNTNERLFKKCFSFSSFFSPFFVIFRHFSSFFVIHFLGTPATKSSTFGRPSSRSCRSTACPNAIGQQSCCFVFVTAFNSKYGFGTLATYATATSQ